MAIIDTVTESRFTDGLKKSFSYAACQVLYEYYWDLSEEIGEPIEYDPIAMRSEWVEYDSEEEAAKDMGYESFYDLENATDVLTDSGVILVRTD